MVGVDEILDKYCTEPSLAAVQKELWGLLHGIQGSEPLNGN